MLRTAPKHLKPNQDPLTPEEQKELLKEIEDIEKAVNVYKVEELPEEIAKAERDLEEEEMYWLACPGNWTGHIPYSNFVDAD